MPSKYKNEVEERFANIEWDEEESPPEPKRATPKRSTRPGSKAVEAKSFTPGIRASSGGVYGFDKLGIRYFEYIGGGSSKYWSIILEGKRFITSYGRIGTSGQTSTKEFGSALEARNEYDKIVREKVRKGYVERRK